jgi:secondary thiamine-phosphate synthase enzyme
MSNLYKYNINTSSHSEMLRINKFVEDSLQKSNVQDGIAVVYCPHTTAGITINENGDPDVVKDILYGLAKVFTSDDINYKHFEGNSHAHLKSSSVGASQTILISCGKLILGTWQDIYFCEFDGPRIRTFYIKIMEG